MTGKGNTTMDNKVYNTVATSLFTAHDITRAALEKCVKEASVEFPGTLRICDLGSAGGANALRLLGWILPIVNNEGQRDIEYVFEDLPSADLNELASTVSAAKLPKNVLTSMIAKSFYERLFGPNSIHLSLSYIALHWLSANPDLSSFPEDKMQFLNISDRNDQPDAYKVYRAQGSDDLARFLKLRADELADNGFGLYLMLGANKGQSKSNHIRRVLDLGVQALLNAASEFERRGEVRLAEWTRRAVAVAKLPMFMRNEEDVREMLSNEHFRSLFDLVEVKSEECLVDNKTAARMTDFVYSVCGNSILGCLKPWALGLRKGDEGPSGGQGTGDEGMKDEDLAVTIMKAMREQYEMLAEKHFPDGKLYLTYMYFVVKRKPRA